MEDHARQFAAWTCLPGLLVTVLAWRKSSSTARRAFLKIAVPLLTFTAFILIGLLNPHQIPARLFEIEVMRPVPHLTWLPTSAHPAASFNDFALNLGLLLVALNLLLAKPPRSWLRGLLAFIALLGLSFAILGTVFKLTGATAILGQHPSPNPTFFSTFIYHNHWGAFALLCAGAAAALAFYFKDTRGNRPLLHTPAPFLVLVVGLILLSIPLTGARASTAAAFLLLTLYGVMLLPRRGASRRPWRLVFITCAPILLLGVATWLATDTFRHEFNESRSQLAEFRQGGPGDARLTILKDTLPLIAEKPFFGWGWNSFRYTYPRVQSALPLIHAERPNTVVIDAHNDWLQLTQETGLVGLALVLLTLIAWLHWGGGLRSGWYYHPSRSLLPPLLVLGLLAIVDFPRANPAVFLLACTLLSVGAALARGLEYRPSTNADPTPSAPSL